MPRQQLNRADQETVKVATVNEVNRQLAFNPAGLTITQVRAIIPGWLPKSAQMQIQDAIRADQGIVTVDEVRTNARGVRQRHVVLRLALMK